jgi:hypothetical protein
MSFNTSGGASATPITNPFTQSWIQSLTQAAEIPATRTIKAKLEWVDAVCLNRPDVDRMAAAKELWSFAETEGLSGLLQIVPTNHSPWVFDREDIFIYERTPEGLAELKRAWSLEAWTQSLGIQPSKFALVAEVTSSDWMALVRSEAVRLKQTLNTAAVTQTSTMHLPCTGRWDGKSWAVQFDQLDWIYVNYEDPVTVTRPSYAEMETALIEALSFASTNVVAKSGPSSSYALRPAQWMNCSERLMPIHQLVMDNAGGFAPWIAKVWSCVWPVIYREQNVLKGQADLDVIRRDIKECLNAQPRLTVWMFMFAKLVCQSQLSRGLGFCADFVD